MKLDRPRLTAMAFLVRYQHLCSQLGFSMTGKVRLYHLVTSRTLLLCYSSSFLLLFFFSSFLLLPFFDEAALMTLYMEATADVRLEVFGDNLCSFTKASWPTLKVGREKCAIYIYIYNIFNKSKIEWPVLSAGGHASAGGSMLDCTLPSPLPVSFYFLVPIFYILFLILNKALL